MDQTPARSRQWVEHLYLLTALLVVVLRTAAMALPSAQTPTQRVTPQMMNALFIATDDLNEEIGCLGSPIAQTPNIDRLAASGMLFRHAYTQQAVCNPSRASLFTGLKPDTLKVWDLRTHYRDTHPDVVTLGQLFKQNGYQSLSIGKILHAGLPGDPPSWTEPELLFNGSGPAYVDDPAHGVDTSKKGKKTATQCLDVPDDAYVDGKVAAAAIEALRKYQQEGKSFFLGVGFRKPHLPFTAPRKYWELYDPNAIPGPEPATSPRNVPEIALHNFKELRGYSDMPKEGQPTPEQVRHLRHGYYAAITYCDAQIGKVLDELDRLGLADNTIVVFWSDHGFHIGEHALWAKTSDFERDAHVPLIIRYPGMTTAGQTSDALVELLDMYPTLADLAGLQAPDTLEGKSLRPVLENPAAQVREAALTQHPRPAYYTDKPEVMGYSIRTQRYRYTEWRKFDSGDIVARELYDHDKDQIESDNIVDEPALTDQVRLLHEQMERAIRS
ncbi:MAG: sulfatase [Phycisphaeraceae bacterium]|nr:sulfatase [Phycisphaeraceae bacterium]